MSFEKVIFVDLIQVVENGIVQVRTKTTVVENGAEIGNSFHRHVVVPGQDYSQEDAKVQAVCKAVHTETAIADYAAKVAQITG